MEQMRNFDWAQDKISEMSGIESEIRHKTQQIEDMEQSLRALEGNRAQRREREKMERRLAKKLAKA